MRLIYIDEAGIDDKEPVRIVAGIIAHGDDHSNFVLSQAMRPIFQAIPEKYRKPYVHATDIYNGHVNKDWAVEERLDVMHKIMAIPRSLGIPVAIGLCKRGGVTPPFETKPKMRPAEQEHWAACYACLGWADQYLSGLCENALVIAENIPSNRDFFKQIPELRSPPFLYMPGIQPIRTTGIEGGMMFVDKADKIGIQLADACAFAFRRYLSGKQFGADFVKAVTGEEPDDNWFAGDISGNLFSW